jgi:hypothetical protein
MFRSACSASLRATLPSARINFPSSLKLLSSSAVCEDEPNKPLDVGPDFIALLTDLDISLPKNKKRLHFPVSHLAAPKELETIPIVLKEEEASIHADAPHGDPDVGEQDDSIGPRDVRKSPAALFGSQSIGQVVLPLELQTSIKQLIAGMYLLPSGI